MEYKGNRYQFLISEMLNNHLIEIIQRTIAGDYKTKQAGISNSNGIIKSKE